MSHDQMVLLRDGFVDCKSLDLKPNFLYVSLCAQCLKTFSFEDYGFSNYVRSAILSSNSCLISQTAAARRRRERPFDPPSVVNRVSSDFINDGYQITMPTAGSGNPATAIFDEVG